MKKRTWVIIVTIVIIAIVLVWLFFSRKKEKPVNLQTESPQYGYISQSVTATGNIQPVDTVIVGSQVSGIIKAVYTDFNAKVKKGQLLAQLDKSLFQAAVKQSRANLQSAQSQQIFQASNFQRQETLYKVGAISKADYDNAVYALNVAKAAVDNAKAQLSSAEKNLSYTDIYSPMDGVVLSRNISAGQTVAASFNTPTLFMIAKDITKMQVQANVDEADIGNVQPDQRSTFTVDAFLDDIFQGSVEEIRLKPTTSANVVTYTTIISAPNDDQKLKPGMTANVTIYTKEVNNALLVSAKALKFEPDSALAKKYTLVNAAGRQEDKGDSSDTGMAKIKDSPKTKASQKRTVWVLEEGNKLVQKKIRIGLNNDTQVQVLEGLTPSDKVVTGVSQTGAKPAAVVKSPFIPTRPGGSRR